MPKHIRIITLSMAVIYGLVALAINIYLPYGNHVFTAASGRSPKGMERLFLSPVVSRFFLSVFPIQCGYSVMDEAWVIHKDTADNLGLIAIIRIIDEKIKLGELSESDFSLVFARRLIGQCNPNDFPPDDYPPLFHAILTQREDLVRYLVANKADLKLRILQPGKPTDGMSAHDFSIHLMNRATDPKSKEALFRISNLLMTD
ncbi:hypothetical protein J5J83_08185 [Azoarcus sp. L1K30]|uniref:hypothetical protein n=1 Tax=Azoarcus sp. L1K30 TaxID=2820277 RepID=UPI001B822DE9|nr:hypothetical protein [Azoarcus sp. L1K30]MBR0566092.1 hypothetical protein [Azoarcus sp. L1K30]